MTAWRDEAACLGTDPDAFFLHGSDKRTLRHMAAKRLCDACPVSAQCLEYAVENDEIFGLWGGLDAGERRRMRRVSA